MKFPLTFFLITSFSVLYGQSLTEQADDAIMSREYFQKSKLNFEAVFEKDHYVFKLIKEQLGE